MSRPRTQVRIHAAFFDDLDQAVERMAQDNPDAAERLPTAVRDLGDRLSEFPRSGRRRGRTVREGRIIQLPGFPNHLVLYEITRAAVVLLRLIHGSRSPRRFRLPPR